MKTRNTGIILLVSGLVICILGFLFSTGAISYHEPNISVIEKIHHSGVVIYSKNRPYYSDDIKHDNWLIIRIPLLLILSIGIITSAIGTCLILFEPS